MKTMNRITVMIGIGVAIFSGSILFPSCTKQRAATPTPGQDYAPASAFYSTYQQPVQVIQVDSPGTGYIFGKMGTRLSGDASIFMFPGNPAQPVIYPIILKLIEIYPEKDMILSKLPSVGGGKILETGGEISIRAFKGTQELVLRPGKKYTMMLDTNKSLLSGMSVFYGFPGIGTPAFTDWTSNISLLNPAISQDTLSKVINQPLFYQMNIAIMGWVSCAQVYTSASLTTNITFTTPSNSTNTQNLDVYLAFTDIHGMMQVYNMKSQAIPIGTNLTVIAIAQDANSANSLVYYSQSTTVTAGQVIALNPTDITSANLITALSAFK